MKKIPLTKGKIALVDDEDYYWLSQWNWFAVEISGGWYARRSTKKTPMRSGVKYETYMHRVVMHPDKGMVVDHKDHNGLNNTKENLRVCTKAQNSRNSIPGRNSTSRYLGVSYRKGQFRNYPWVAQLKFEGKRILNKKFATEVEAAEAYDIIAKEYFGEFANLNFPNNTYKRTAEEVLNHTNNYSYNMSDSHKEKLRKSREHIDFKKLHRSKRGKPVVDTETGEVFGSLIEAAESIGMTKYKLSNYLTGFRTNKTTLKYLEI